MRVFMRNSHHRPTVARGSHSGATLTEVLISLLAMGIGVVAVATMFPISVLKSVRATQLTRAAILTQNANSQIHADPRILNDPDFATSPGEFEHYSEDLNGNGKFEQGEDSGETFYGATGLNRGIYIVDPLGWAYNNGLPTGTPGIFGNNSPTGFAGFPRHSGMAINPATTSLTDTQIENAAAALVGLPDSWETIGEEVMHPTTPFPGSSPANRTIVKFADATQFDFSVVTTGGNPISRAVFFLFQPNGGVLAVTRRITGVNSGNNTLTVTPPLPASLTASPGIIDRVRVETQQEQFTWLLSVRRPSHGVPLADIVVFYNRSLGPDSERLYESSFRAAAGSDGTYADGTYRSGFLYDPFPGIPGIQEIDPTAPGDEVTLQWTTIKPNYKRGNFIFSSANGEWYRIINILRETDTSVVLQLDRRVKSGAVPSALPLTEDNAILPIGVIDVFPYKAQ